MIDPKDKKQHDALKRIANLFKGCDEFQNQLENVINQLNGLVGLAKALGSSIRIEIDALVKLNGEINEDE